MKKTALTILKITAALILLFVIAVIIQNIIASKKLHRVEQQMLSEGLPLTWDDVEKMYADVDPDGTGREALISALEVLKYIDEPDYDAKENIPIVGYADLTSIGEPIPAEMMTLMTNITARTANALDAIESAVDMKPLVFMKPTNATDIAIVGSIGSLRRAARLYYMNAVVKSELGDTDAAVDSVIQGINLCNAIETDPYLIMNLVRIACMGIIYNGLERTISSENIDSDHLDLLEKALSHQPASSKQSLIGEAVFMRAVFEQMRNARGAKFRGNSKMTRDMLQLLCGYPLEIIEMLSCSDGWLKMNQAYAMEQALLYHTVWDQPWAEFCMHHDELRKSIPWLYRLLNSSPDTFFQVKKRELRSQGSWDMARIAVAAKKYILANETQPKTLNDLTPKYIDAIPSNPFTGDEYDYESGPNGVTISFKECKCTHSPEHKCRHYFSFTVLSKKPTPQRAEKPMFKGVELYSWKPEGQPWHFTLLPGTNRAKSIMEVTSNEAIIVGIPDLKVQLAALAKGDHVFWRSISGTVPPELVEELKTFCKKHEINLTK